MGFHPHGATYLPSVGFDPLDPPSDFSSWQPPFFSSAEVAHLLQHDVANPGGREANIEGPMYVVKRGSLPECLGCETAGWLMGGLKGFMMGCLTGKLEDDLVAYCEENDGPRYRIIVKNQVGTTDLIDDLPLGKWLSEVEFMGFGGEKKV